jgi:hypothetical protein
VYKSDKGGKCHKGDWLDIWDNCHHPDEPDNTSIWDKPSKWDKVRKFLKSLITNNPDLSNFWGSF